MMLGAFRILTGGLGAILGYIATHRWTWYVIAVLAIFGAGYYLRDAKIPDLQSLITSSTTRSSSEEKTVYSDADLVITATGGQTTVEFYANGTPRSVRNEGGRLEVQARISTSQHESSTISESSSSSSAYQANRGRRKHWKWAVHGGLLAPGADVQIGLDRHIGRILFCDVGAGVLAIAPVTQFSVAGIRKEGKIGARLLLTFP